MVLIIMLSQIPEKILKTLRFPYFPLLYSKNKNSLKYHEKLFYLFTHFYASNHFLSILPFASTPQLLHNIERHLKEKRFSLLL